MREVNTKPLSLRSVIGSRGSPQCTVSSDEDFFQSLLGGLLCIATGAQSVPRVGIRAHQAQAMSVARHSRALNH